MKTTQSATGFLAAILIGLIAGGILYFMITNQSEVRVKQAKSFLEQRQQLDQYIEKRTEQAKRAEH